MQPYLKFSNKLIKILFCIYIVGSINSCMIEQKDQNEIITREDLAKLLKTSTSKKNPPHYEFIGKPVNWYGELISCEKADHNKTKFKFWVNSNTIRKTDTILVSEMSNYKEFCRQHKNDIVWFKGNIIRIDPDVSTLEVIYVNGYISEAQFN